MKEEIVQEINLLRKQKNAVLLAHYYQIPDIQDIADFVGDSLQLAQNALQTKADMIVFAGVHFMAETAKILNPTKKVLLPDLAAGCSLADSCPADEFRLFKQQHPDHIVITYINSSVEIKMFSDVICTSSNAVKIVQSFPKDQKIIFAPDKNLGAYVNSITGRNMVLWNGSCHVHDMLTSEHIIKLKLQHQDAKLIAHPECKAVVLELADFIGSTAAMLNYTKSDNSKKYIVATETGIIHQMKKTSPEKEFIVVNADETCSCNDCEYMKKISLEKILKSLQDEIYEISLPNEVIDQAKYPILKMLKLSAL